MLSLSWACHVGGHVRKLSHVGLARVKPIRNATLHLTFNALLCGFFIWYGPFVCSIQPAQQWVSPIVNAASSIIFVLGFYFCCFVSAIRELDKTRVLREMFHLLTINLYQLQIPHLKFLLKSSPTIYLECKLFMQEGGFSIIKKVSYFCYEYHLLIPSKKGSRLIPRKWLMHRSFFPTWRPDNAPPPFKSGWSAFGRPVVANSWEWKII